MSTTTTSSRGTWRRRIAATVAALMVTPVSVAALGVGTAGADTAPVVSGTPETVSADVLPTVQINGVVWDQVVVGDTVYATGSFSKARPAGAAVGTNETDRSNILAYDLVSGNLISSWAPSLNAQGRSLAASADGSTIYVGGDFTSVNGVTRNRVVALNAVSGAVVTGFNANVNTWVNSVVLSGSTLYLGGAFTVVGNQPRSRLAAVDASTGALRAWAPSADLEVRTVTVPAGANRVIAGGNFTTLNGVANLGMGAIDATTGAVLSWPVNTILKDYGPKAAIWSLKSAGGQVFGSGYSYSSTGNFESTFSSDVNGNLLWVNGCRGDNYDNVPIGDVLYTVSHAHDCNSIGGHPQTTPTWTYQRAQAMTTYADPSGHLNTAWFPGRPHAQLLHWLPSVAAGSFTGQSQGAWTVEGDSRYVVLGGEFPRVNNKDQQGLVRFAVKSIAPNKDAIQGYNELTPTLTPVAPGSLRISWQGAWDRDNARLTYEVLRGDTVATSTVLKTFTFDESNWWTRPMMAFVDTTAAPGSTQTYRVRVKDAFNNGFAGLATTGTVPAGSPSAGPYRDLVASDGANRYWRLGEGSGSVGLDWANGNDLTLSGVTRNAAGAVSGDSDTATTFNGSATVPATTGLWVKGMQVFTTEAWFKTTTSRGGKIIGFGDSKSALSSNYDRSVYMDNSGAVRFGATSAKVLASRTGLNDGQWHHVVASLGPSGIRLVVDGVLAGSDSSVKAAGNFWGYWRVGGDQLNGWASKPSSNSFAGTIDEVAVYPTELSVAQAANHYAVARGAAGNAAPTASFTTSANNLAVSFDGSGSSDPDGSVVSWAWDFGDGATGAGVTAAHTYAASGTYTVKLTVTDNGGLSTTTTQQVTALAPNQLPTAAFTTTANNLAVSFDANSSSDPDGSIVSWAWDFGDGSTGTGATAAHNYATAGTYTVKLTVTDNRGGQATRTGSITVAGAPANFVEDAFARAVASGWGSADLGGAWTVSGTASNYTVSGGVGRIVAAAGASRTASLNGVSQTAVEITTDLAFDKVQTGGGSYVAVIGRRVDASNDYRLKLRAQVGGAVTAQLIRNVGGAEAAIQTVTTVPGLSWNANEVLKVRFRVSGTGTTNLTAKVWKDGTAEPAAWQLSGTDATAALQANGGVGVWAYLSGSVTNAPMTFLVDNFIAGPVG